MGKRQERAVGQLVLAIEPWGSSDEASLTEGASDPPVVSTDAKSPEATGKRRKWYSLYDKVYKAQTLEQAWERVRANKGAAGSDGMSIEQTQADAEGLLQALHSELREKRYHPRPVRRRSIPKPGGGERQLGIPCVRDRVVQTALAQILEPIFEAKFVAWSHGFRPGRGCQTALELVDRAVAHGYEWIVDADIKRFFDTVDHETLLTAVNEEVSDGSVLRLIRMFVQAGVMVNGAKVEVEEGTPQGGPLSPLLANIYLHPLDIALKTRGFGFVRYADDFVVFARTEAKAQEALSLIRQTLETLGLMLSEEKTRVAPISDGFDFLGFSYSRRPDGLYKMVRRKSQAKFREAIRQRTKRHAGQKRRKPQSCTVTRLRRDERIMRMIDEVNKYLVSWHGYFRQIRFPKKEREHHPPYFTQQDKFVRRRLRSVIAGRYAKGRWQAQVLPNALLSELGLLSLDGLHLNYRRTGRALPTVG